MELINKDTPQVKEFISSLDSMLNGIEFIIKHYKPHLNGERFLSNNEVSKKLNVKVILINCSKSTTLKVGKSNLPSLKHCFSEFNLNH